VFSSADFLGFGFWGAYLLCVAIGANGKLKLIESNEISTFLSQKVESRKPKTERPICPIAADAQWGHSRFSL